MIPTQSIPLSFFLFCFGYCGESCFYVKRMWIDRTRSGSVQKSDVHYEVPFGANSRTYRVNMGQTAKMSAQTKTKFALACSLVPLGRQTLHDTQSSRALATNEERLHFEIVNMVSVLGPISLAIYGLLMLPSCLWAYLLLLPRLILFTCYAVLYITLKVVTALLYMARALYHFVRVAASALGVAALTIAQRHISLILCQIFDENSCRQYVAMIAARWILNACIFKIMDLLWRLEWGQPLPRCWLILDATLDVLFASIGCVSQRIKEFQNHEDLLLESAGARS